MIPPSEQDGVQKQKDVFEDVCLLDPPSYRKGPTTAATLHACPTALHVMGRSSDFSEVSARRKYRSTQGNALKSN